MASSGTQVHWTGPGLVKAPQRRRWAWAEEKEDTDGSRTQVWGHEQPFPDATSPELLEDFRQAQQHPLSLERDPASQESESSSGEDTEAEDVDSPESTPLPLPWLPLQDGQLDLTEEEPDEVPGSPGSEAAEESSPRPGCADQDYTRPMVPQRGQAGSWVASGEEAGGNESSEPPEAHRYAGFCSARSWSSGTVSLGQPSDSLDSPWEGEADIPQTTARTGALLQSSHHHFLPPDDRARGGVALATTAEFQDRSASPAQSPEHSENRWGRDTASLSSPWSEDPTWKQTKTSSKPLPSRFTGSINPLSLQSSTTQKDQSQPKQGDTLASHSSSHVPKYGRGRLNYPLPDFSKVGPRVRFPKDESYRPPKSRNHNRQPQDATGPLIFKSPAEIVREVLLSSGEVSPAKDPPTSYPVARVPQEFQTPEQATKLVHQLQEDYHKLLTKYAEAENTIDQLRLGAKVNLYSEPPQPSHSSKGTVPPGTKVLSFTIPQPHSAEWCPGTDQDQQASEATGWLTAPGNLSPSSPSNTPTVKGLPESQGTTMEWNQGLASQASRLLAKVDSFEGLMQEGNLTPQDRLQGFQRLRAAYRGLEDDYLQTSRGQHLATQSTGSKGTPGDPDYCRELEAEIRQLRMRLEELQDHMGWNQHELAPSEPDPTQDSASATSLSCQPARLPTPLGMVPTAAMQNPSSELPVPAGPCPPPVDVELSPRSSEVEGSLRDLPAPLKGKELQMEQDFHGLLDRYLSMKSFPEALRVEEEVEEEEGEEHNQKPKKEDSLYPLEVDGAALAGGRMEATHVTPRQHPVQAEKSHREPSEPSAFQTSVARHRYAPGLGKAEAASPGRGMAPKSTASQQGSMASLEGSGTSEHFAHKTLCQARGLHREEPWMASPETDSGFVGSETSRVSPLTQTPEHRLSHLSIPGSLAHPVIASAPHKGALPSKPRGPVIPRRAAEPNTPRNRAHRHLPTLSLPARQGALGSHLERATAAKMVAPGSEFEGQKQMSEQLPHRTARPAPTLPPAASPLHPGRAESSPSLLTTRTARDQAIRDLQAEVSRLRLRLEDSLHPPSQGSQTHPGSAFESPSRTWGPLTGSSVTWGSHCGSKSTERLSGEHEDTEQAVSTGRHRTRSSSVPREMPRRSLSSESAVPSPRLLSEKSKTTEHHLQAEQEGTRQAGHARQKDRASLRGQYTGQEYHVLSPKAVPRNSDVASCPYCQPMKTQDADAVSPASEPLPDSATASDPPGQSATDVLRCPLCGQMGSLAEEDNPASAPSAGLEKTTTRRDAAPASIPKRKSRRKDSPTQQPPGLWYLAATPPVTAPLAFAYILPYPPATVYYASPAATSAPSGSQKPVRANRHSVQLDLDELDELQAALSQAVQAAESVRTTTRHMSQSLAANLRQAQGLQGSCLF
ncbi:microtubule organization protein AKNA isoform X3 [Dipodomys spectabilis]|uniref:microtubule organization protein AKNA isoform X3 n=1 Tax=Dipodomys spectabilis TaxID=105255 RepID=UPI001C544979|nr:microtubule organization protein AKNA isoform X3 [Dipodomys spectabilis]